MKKSTTFLLILLAIFFTSTLYLLYLNFNKTPTTNTLIPQTGIVPTENSIPTTVPTADWKTYTNQTLGYSFKYPANWGKSNSVESFMDPTNSFTLTIEVNQTNLDVNSWKVKKCVIAGTDFCSNSVQGPIIGSIQYNHPKSHYDLINTLIAHENQIFDISLASINPNQSADQLTKQTYNQILSTFKFTDTVQSLIPADSQTPVAGICAEASKNQVTTVIMGSDNVPSPRCIKVIANQKLTIVNNSPESIHVSNPEITINPGDNYEFPKAVGLFLAPGVHQIAGAEIWLTK